MPLSRRRLLAFTASLLVPTVEGFCATKISPADRLLSKRYSRKNSDARSSVPAECICRRSVLNQLIAIGTTTTLAPSPSWAGEVGARITKAVTTSDLGISVRTSVVKGAQVIDQLDGKWESFSDRFGLGSERLKQGSRPTPKVIPDPLPLNLAIALQIIALSDRIFCATTGIPSADLQLQVNKVANLVRVSFERSGVSLKNAPDQLLNFENAGQYNFAVYAHFKAYSDLVVEKKIPFQSFKRRFEADLGQELVSLVVPGYRTPANKDKTTNLRTVLVTVDKFLAVWKESGLVALTERTLLDDEKIEDWVDDTSDLEFSIALDGDITLNSQVLLQEQGFRLYPNFCRFAIGYLMEQVSSDQKVSTMDYYFDTDYNSDPNRFEVKEVLLSIQLENP